MSNDVAKRLLARIKTVRETLGLSQEAFAERAGMKYKYYQHIEAGRRRDVRLSTLQKLAKACGLELAELLDFTTDPVVIAEDKGENGLNPGSGKTARRSSKRRAESRRTTENGERRKNKGEGEGQIAPGR